MHSWQKTKIIKSVEACADIKSIIVKTENISEHRAGQHYEICISGSNAMRKYSVVSPEHITDHLEFGVQLIEGGALSPKLWELKEGDEIEIRGPIGSSFVWDFAHQGPLVLIGAGSGITPLMSIYHSYQHKYPDRKCVFIMSAKDESRIMHYDSMREILITRFTGIEGMIDFNFLKNSIGNLSFDKNVRVYISGPDNFIDDMVDNVLKLGISGDYIKSERFI